MIGAFWWTLLLLLYLLSAVTRDARLFLFALMLTAAASVSALWARYSLSELRYSRRFARRRLEFGEETELTLDIYNAKPLPLPWVLISDQYPDGVELLTGQLGVSRAVSFKSALVNFLALRWYERVRRVYRLRGSNRGVFRFGPVDIYAGDVFGFRRQHRYQETIDRLIVYPKVVPVEVLGLPAARPSGDFAATRRVLEDPLRFRGVREYQPGDSIRFVHWKATARLGQLQTRVFDPSASRVLMLVVDVQTAERPYSLVPEYLELLVTAAASLAADSLSAGYSVGLMANTGPVESSELIRIPAGRHPDQIAVLLEAMAQLTGFRLMPLPRLLSVIGADLPFGATVIVLTSRPSEETQEQLLALQDLGYAVTLLTVGEEPPDIAPQLETHHLGGAESWNELASLQLA
ncbi:MAG: DUF58 domain-containing protein [Anaerolineae bacterium]|nr:DUF58 domain-containing protein [Anaerolineae bacterium]